MKYFRNFQHFIILHDIFVSEIVLTSHEQFGHTYHQPWWNCLLAMGTCSLILSLKLLSLILFISSEIPWKMCKIFECWLFRHCSCGCSFHHCYDKVLWLLNIGPVRRTSGTTFSQLPSYKQAVGNGQITLLLKDSSIFPNLRFQFQSFFLIFDWFFTKSLSLIGNNLIKKIPNKFELKTAIVWKGITFQFNFCPHEICP